ncbi:hypothetical protein DIPPA_25909 [Diplonema papillatum]|nr:hypothetical protein DIPPA_25909 [Diplonema papillatum]
MKRNVFWRDIHNECGDPIKTELVECSIRSLNSEQRFCSLHRVNYGETVQLLSLLYHVDANTLREKNLRSRCAVDDYDLGDLSACIIPRSLDSHSPRPSATWMQPNPSSPVLYSDSWVVLQRGLLHIRDLVSSREGRLHGTVPTSAIASINSVSLSRLDDVNLITWATTSTSSLEQTSLVSIKLRSMNLTLSDGTVIRSQDLVRKGFVVQVQRTFDFVQAIRPCLSSSLP